MSRETKEAVLCLIVDCQAILMGRATDEMGYAKGKLVCPYRTVLPNANLLDEVVECCTDHMMIVPILDRTELVAEKFYHCRGLDHDLLVHVFMVTRYLSFPTDTKMLTDTHWWGFESIPFDEMFSDDEVWLLPVIAKGWRLRLEFESYGPDDSRLICEESPLAAVSSLDPAPA